MQKRIGFDKISAEELNLYVIGGLKYEFILANGKNRKVDLTYIGHHEILARDLLASLDQYCKPENIQSILSISTYSKSIHEFLEFCKVEKFDDSLKLKDVDVEMLLSYRGYIKTKLKDNKNEVKRRRFGNLIRLIEAGNDINIANIELIRIRNFPQINDSDKTRPYTREEAIDIEYACRVHIEEVVKNISDGKILLSKGYNPKNRKPKLNAITGRIEKIEYEDRAWNQIENVIWYVVNVLGGAFYGRKELKIMRGHSSYLNAVSGAWKSNFRMGDVFKHLYPLSFDLIPFVILLAKKTGRNESSLLQLERDCLVEIDGRWYLKYKKYRGSDIVYKKYVPNDGLYSPVELINLVIRITEPLRKFVSTDNKKYLFIGLTIRGHGLDSVKPIDASYYKYQMNSSNGWCSKYKLTDFNGNVQKISLKSLRVYYLSEKYKKCGQLAKVSVDANHKSSGTTSNHYLNNESLVDIHENAVINGILAAKNVATPMVLPDRDKLQAAKLLKTDANHANGILSGEQDVFFSSCRDFNNRPGGEKDTPCTEPWSCFFCANSIFTRHVLPRVLTFVDFMIKQKQCMNELDWSEKFACVWIQIHKNILPKFSSDAIAEAEKFKDVGIFYIPISKKFKP